jgi:hypothetical protein
MKMTPTDHANLLFIVQKIAEEKDLPFDPNINAIIRTIATRKNVTIMKEERAAIQDFVNKIKGKESSSGANNSSAGSSGGARRKSRKSRKTRKARKTKSRKSHRRR